MTRYPCSVTYALTVLSILCGMCCYAITLRIRLTSGALKRIDVDDNTSTYEFIKEIESNGYCKVDSSYLIGNSIVNAANISHGSMIDVYSLKHGDIIKINQSKNKMQESHGPSSAKIDKEVKSEKSRSTQSKRGSTVGDIINQRKELIKIAREKPDKNKVAFISMSSGRILKRLSTGGFGIALGRKTVERKSISHRSLSKKTSSKSDKEEEITSYSILAVCEIMSCDENSNENLPWNINEANIRNKIEKIKNIASKLGLQTIGGIVGLPIRSKAIGWSAYHAHVLLQLYEMFHAKDLLMLSLSDPTKITTGDETGKAFEKRKLLQDKDLGLSIEAFFLSNQSIAMYNSSIFSPVPSLEVINKYAIRNTESKTEESLVKFLSTIQLMKPVLLQSDEADSVDSLLLAVPVSVKTLKSPEVEFEHSFPGPYELKDPKLAQLAKKHALKILGRTTNHETIQRLRDPNLFIYLSDILDDLSLVALGSALASSHNTNKLPGNVIAALDLVRMVLT